MCPTFGISPGSTFQGTRNIRKKLGAQNVHLHVHTQMGIQMVKESTSSGYLNLDMKSREAKQSSVKTRGASLTLTQCCRKGWRACGEGKEAKTLETAEGTGTHEGSGKAWDGADWKAGGTEDTDRPNSL